MKEVKGLDEFEESDEELEEVIDDLELDESP